MPDCKWLRHSIRKRKNGLYLRRIAPVQDVFFLRRGAIFLKGDHHG